MNDEIYLPLTKGVERILIALVGLLHARRWTVTVCDRIYYAIPVAMIEATIARLTRVRTNLRALAWRLGKGPLPARRSPVFDPDAPPRKRPAPPPGIEDKILLPTTWAWLPIILASTSGRLCLDLRKYLETPEMRAFIALSPRVGETLRPLCRMLGIPRETLGLAPRRRRAKAKPDITPDDAAPKPSGSWLDAKPPRPAPLRRAIPVRWYIPGWAPGFHDPNKPLPVGKPCAPPPPPVDFYLRRGI